MTPQKPKVRVPLSAPRRKSVYRKEPKEDGAPEDRRAQILEASARLFAEYGFETTSVRQIADEVHILAGSLYHHFSTKDEILHEIIRDPVAKTIQDHIRISRLPVDPELRLVAATILRFHRQTKNRPAFAILQHDFKFLRRREEFSYVESASNLGFQLLDSILKEGMASKLFHSDIDTYLMIATMSRLLNSAMAWFQPGQFDHADEPQRYTFDRIVDFHLDCILRMIRSPLRVDEPIPRAVCEQLVMPRAE